jgi:hypothetical protein
MQVKRTALKNLPCKLQAAMLLMALHILLYSVCVALAFFAEGEMKATWIMHVPVAGFLLSEMNRPKASLYYLIPAYSLFTVFKAMGELNSLLLLGTYFSLLFVVPCILIERNFYLKNKVTVSAP